MSQDQLRQFAISSIDDGVQLIRDRLATRSYYLTAKVQISAAQGSQYVRVDAELAEAILLSLASGGTLSKAEIEREIMPRITDAGRYSSGEAILARLLIAAIDDRRVVMINDQQINISDAGERALERELRSFWGKLGATARWGRGDPAEPYMP